MSSLTGTLRIGDVARLLGTTPRTIRHYEELGLLPGAEEREAGRHRVYTEEDLAQLREVMRLRRLLGLSLDELRDVVAAEAAKSARHVEWQLGPPEPRRRRQLLDEALEHVEHLLELLAAHRAEIESFERELRGRRRRVREMQAENDRART